MHSFLRSGPSMMMGLTGHITGPDRNGPSPISTCFPQKKSLEHVQLLPVPTLLGLGRFPSHYDASRKKLLVSASDVPPHAQVLMVSHPSELPGNPDPSGRQFSALKRFLRETEEREKDKEEGGCGGGFGYVWAAFSCTSANRIKPTFKTHLHNVLTVRKWVRRGGVFDWGR